MRSTEEIWLQMAKYEFEHEIEESKEEKKSLERDNMMLQMRVSVLDNDSRKQKDAIRELQNKLEAALNEAKKNQNIAVATSRAPQRSPSNTDARFISASDAATADGATQESPLHVQIKETGKGRSPSKSKVFPSRFFTHNLLKCLFRDHQHRTLKTYKTLNGY